ncbi:patatin-like phospholipase [Aureococcus anophagefferens]|nr:patatin-like phospholipase [Aureococcus anophagefferens]
MSSAAQTLVAAGGSVAIAVAYGTGSQFHALAIVGISFMGAVACAVHASAREAADEARWWSLQCRRFELDPAGGFLPVPSPGEVELEEEFAPWERLGGRLATLNASGTLRRYVAEHVPLVDAGKLLDIEPFPKQVAALRRAYVILGLAAFDVDADDLARRPVIPKQLAVPWVRVCRELDLPDGAIAACGTDLWNYKGPDAAAGPRFLTDAGRERDRAMRAAAEKQKRYGARQILTPRFLWGLRPRTRGGGRGAGAGAVAPVDLVTSMTGTATEASFHLLATRMQARAARELPGLVRLPNDVAEKKAWRAQRTLRALAAMLGDFCAIFEEVHASVDKALFYDRYRPLLSGSWDAPLACEAEDGSVFHVRSKGPSAGQSTIFLLLDIALGVARDDSEHGAFQRDMLAYMPPAHRALVDDYADRFAAAGPLANLCRRGVLRRDRDACKAA